ncbi:MAG: CoA transferase subunit A [bacterium]
MNKLIALTEAVDKIKDGMVLMVGGFLTTGGPNSLMDKLSESTVKDLTIICNDAAFDEKGMGKLIANGQVKKIITSYIGSNKSAVEQMNAGSLEVEFVPQGTLAERVRAGGSGLGGVLTPTGIGTKVEEGKQVIEVDGKPFLLEKPLKADAALLGASMADESGNLFFKGTTRNFNPLMAMAAEIVLAETAEVVKNGEILPENVHTPAILVDYIYKK